MKKAGFSSYFLAAIAGLLLSSPARAETSFAPLILPRQEGGFIEIHSGKTADTRDALMSMFGDASATPIAENATAMDPTTAPISGADQSVGFSLKDAILRGRQMLDEKLAAENAVQKKPKTVPSLNTWVDVTLAVWNSTTDGIRLVDVRKNGQKVKVETEDEDARVSVHRSNGVNTEFVLSNVSSDHVVAVEYPIFTQKYLTKKKFVYELRNVVYTPYSDQIDTPETVAWGKSSLDTVIAEVYDGLRRQGIRSRAYPDRLLADVVDPDWIRSIIMIEHLSPNALLKGDPAPAMESIYVILAANPDNAFAFAKSTAGAFGMLQFIPSTYKLMTKRTDLALIKDFTQGMTDQHNAIKTAVAYLDADLASMPLSVRDLYNIDPVRVGEYLAAAYNGGGARVRKAIKLFGDAWSSASMTDVEALRARRRQALSDIASYKAQIKKTSDAKKLKSLKAGLAKSQDQNQSLFNRIEAMKPAILRTETTDYVRKYRVVMDQLNPAPVVTLASAS